MQGTERRANRCEHTNRLSLYNFTKYDMFPVQMRGGFCSDEELRAIGILACIRLDLNCQRVKGIR